MAALLCDKYAAARVSSQTGCWRIEWIGVGGVGRSSEKGVGSGGASPEPCNIASTHPWPVDDAELYSRVMNLLLATGRYLEALIHCDFLPLWGTGSMNAHLSFEQLAGRPLTEWTRDIARMYGKAARL
ncbi:hypothetical protein [Bradyrhizobium vignae]|uniref:hypothetical protein n=1 Tax=Bradyrhizobium vignae TaxID=1549949 RepID=UPI00100AE902|nr:hypothetical protein [Bradyrhizobium vignae]RXG97190.1 hypothetical protein EAV90_22755 [Bradyrhizobium vignae]